MNDGSSMSGTIFRIGHFWDGNWTTTGTGLNEVTAGEVHLTNTGSRNTWNINVGADAPLLITSKITAEGNPFTINKSGAGRLTLTNTESTMTGTFNVTEGELQLTATGTTGKMSLNLNNADLYIGEDNAGGKVALTNPFTMQSGELHLDIFGDGTFDELDLSALAANPFTDVDIFIHIDENLRTTDVFDVLLYDPLVSGWDTFDTSRIHLLAGATDSGSLWGFTLGGGSLEVSQDFSKTPEPATWAMMLLGLLGIFAVRRRAEKK